MARVTKLRLLTLLTELEQHLQQLDWWQSHAPCAQALQSEQPFCVDTLEFAQWLQWVFIPRMGHILISDHPLPNQCAIHEMAEVVYRDQSAAVASLLQCLKTIDATITTQHAVH